MLVMTAAAKDTVVDSAKSDGANQTVCMPILMYHHISANPSKTGTYLVSPDEFENDLKQIVSEGYTTVTTKQIEAFVKKNDPLPEKPIMITFDDGNESFYYYAFPLLKKYNMTAVFSPVGKYTELTVESGDLNVEYASVTWEQIDEMNKSGFVEIGNHTYNMHDLSPRKGCAIKKGESTEEYLNKLNEDIPKMQKLLKEKSNVDCNIFTYPYGNRCDKCEKFIKEIGFKFAFICEEKVNKLSYGNEDKLYRLGRFNRPSGVSSSTFFKKFK